MAPGLGAKYPLVIQWISKPRAEYKTDEYFELDLPVAPAVMVAEEILVEGEDVSEDRLEAAIRRHLGFPELDAGTLEPVRVLWPTGLGGIED